METLERILKIHAAAYPLMQPQDAVKLVYQNEFGGGHLIRDEQSCLNYLKNEYTQTPNNPTAPLLEEIGNGLVRVNLAALDEGVYPIEKLGQDFIRSAALHRGNMDSFKEKLGLLYRATQTGLFSFSPAELESYLRDYAAAGFPMVSHSEIYRQSYKPAYRVVLRSCIGLKL